MTCKYNDYEADYYRMTGTIYKRSCKCFLNIIMKHNLSYMYWFRKYQVKKSLIARLFLYKLTRKYGLEISSKAKIGKGLYLGHPYNITIGNDVVIGNNVNIHKGVTIGRTNRGNIGSPQIGDNVYIGINSSIVGNIKIGNDVLVAPNSYINFNVPPHSIVIGNPGKIHYKLDATKDYVCFKV